MIHHFHEQLTPFGIQIFEAATVYYMFSTEVINRIIEILYHMKIRNLSRDISYLHFHGCFLHSGKWDLDEAITVLHNSKPLTRCVTV